MMDTGKVVVNKEDKRNFRMNEKLTEEQIKNWREVLIKMIGPYALLMPREEIQAFHDRTQRDIDKMQRDTDRSAIIVDDSATEVK